MTPSVFGHVPFQNASLTKLLDDEADGAPAGRLPPVQSAFTSPLKTPFVNNDTLRGKSGQHGPPAGEALCPSMWAAEQQIPHSVCVCLSDVIRMKPHSSSEGHEEASQVTHQPSVSQQADAQVERLRRPAASLRTTRK